MKYQSNILSDARGKLNGMVFTRGRYGAVIRNKVSPVQPDTSSQQLAKQNFGALSSSFRGLGDAAITAWNAAALNWPKSNTFGQTYYPSGLNLYVGLNQNLLQAAQATITEPPAPSELPVIVPTAMTANVTDTELYLSMEIDGATVVPAGYILVIECTPPVSPGRSFVKTLYRWVDNMQPADSPSGVNIWPNYVAKFGVPAAGTKIYARYKLIDIETGQASLYSQSSAIVATTP